MENTIMEDQSQDQSLSNHVKHQEKNQKASEGWFDLITQIALDYQRLKHVNGGINPVSDQTSNDAFDHAEDVLAI